MPERHQYQTEERDAAEARVREARKAFDDQWEVFVEAKQRFEENAGNHGEGRTFTKACSALAEAGCEWHSTKLDLADLDRSIP